MNKHIQNNNKNFTIFKRYYYILSHIFPYNFLVKTNKLILICYGKALNKKLFSIQENNLH